MDAISLLKSDHKKVGELFEQLLALGDTAHASRQKLFRQIDTELTVHANIEETVFYPALKGKTKANSEERDEVLEAYEEHALVKGMIAELEGLDPKDETYNAKLQVLSELVKHHVKEEETEMFKQAKELFTFEELKQLGGQLLQAKEKLLVDA